MIGQGVSSRSSHSAAAGRMTPSAKPWTHSRMSFWSWLSSREKGVSSSCVDRSTSSTELISEVAISPMNVTPCGVTSLRVISIAMALDTASAELTIDELARETGMTVRNIRSHATRGLLQPPVVRARTGFYGVEHVARLRLIQELQANGYNLAAVKHLLQRGDGQAERVLGFARSILAPFEVEQPEVVDAAELAAKWGAAEIDPKLVERSEKLGLVAPLGDGRYEIL